LGTCLNRFRGRSWAFLGILRPSWAVLGLSWARLGLSWACLGPSWGRLGAILGLSWTHLGTFWARLGASWGHLEAVLDCLGAAWVVLGGFEPSWAVLGRFWGHFGVYFGAQSWIFFGHLFTSRHFCWTNVGQLLGPLWGPFWDQIGPRRGQDGTKRAIKSFKDQNSCICKNNEKTLFFNVFGVQDSFRKPKKAPKMHPKSSKASKIRIRKWTPKLPIVDKFLANF